MKKGRFSLSEQKFISDNIKTDSSANIAKVLNRDPNTVEEYIKKNFHINISPEEQAAYDLERRPFWPEIQKQFSHDELRLFKYHWSRIISQFRDDVIPTEELQVIDLIKLELLMNRSLQQNRGSIDQISNLQSDIQRERGLNLEDQNLDLIFNMERQIASLKAAQESLNKDYRELQTKKNTMLKEMKGTREQRVKRLEDSKQSIVGWISYLMTNPAKAEKYGIEMEKMRLATIQEKKRLGAYHKYQDQIIDKPFLNCETVSEEDSETII